MIVIDRFAAHTAMAFLIIEQSRELVRYITADIGRYAHTLSRKIKLVQSCTWFQNVGRLVCARAEAHVEWVRLVTGGTVLAGPVFAYLGLPFLAPEICTRVTIARQNWLLGCRGKVSE